MLFKLTFLPDANLLAWLLIAVSVDFITGFSKAIARKEQRTSKAMRRTIIKLLQYTGVLAVVLIIGNAAKDNKFANVQTLMEYANSGLLIFMIYIEAVSILENLLAIDDKSMLSRYVLKRIYKILTLTIKNNAIHPPGITAIILVLFITGCKTVCPVSSNISRDSTVEREKIFYRDTVIQLPGDTLEIGFAIPCPEVNVDEYFTNGNMTITAKSSGNNNVIVRCKTDSLTLVIDSLITVIKEKEKYHKEIKIIPAKPVKIIEYKTPKWCWYLLTINLLLLAWRFRNPIRSLFKNEAN